MQMLNDEEWIAPVYDDRKWFECREPVDLGVHSEEKAF